MSYAVLELEGAGVGEESIGGLLFICNYQTSEPQSINAT